MKKFSVSIFIPLFFGLLGCAGVPMAHDVEQVLGKPFTNPPRPEKKWVHVKDKDGRELTVIDSSYNSIRGNRYKSQGNFEEPIYYKKESEGVNTRYFINWGSGGLCSYSLLVGPDDIILSWRNEGSKLASQCHRP